MPFNLKDERDEGHFDETGNYVWRKEQEEPDAWLANMDEAAMENAIGEAAAALKVLRPRAPLRTLFLTLLFTIQRKNDALEKLDDEAPIVHDREALKEGLLQLLQPGETIPAGLRRLGGGKSGGWRGALHAVSNLCCI